MVRIIALLIMSCFASMVWAEAKPLILDQFLVRVLQHNPGAERILIQKMIAEGQYKSSLGINDFVLSAQVGRQKSQPNPVTGLEPSEVNRNTYGMSLERIFSATGTRVRTEYNNVRTNQTPAAFSAGATYYEPSITLKITQPLLKNAGGIQDRLNIRLDGINLTLADLQSQEELESYLTRLAALYLDWYLAYREMQIAKNVYEQAKQQEAVTRLKVSRQVSERFELYRIQEVAQGYYSRWRQARGNYLGLSKEVLLQIKATAATTTTEAYVPVDPALSGFFQSNIKRNFSTYIRTKSRLKIILDNIQHKELILVRARKNAKKPSLDLSLGYTRHGIDRRSSDAHGASFDRNDHTVILEYRFPIGNRASKGRYQAQLAVQRQAKADIAQRFIDAESALAKAIVQRKQTRLSIDAVDKQIVLADKKIKAEKRLYRIGRLDLFQLLQDQTAQLENRLRREQLLIQLHKLDLTIGELLDKNLEKVSALKGMIP